MLEVKMKKKTIKKASNFLPILALILIIGIAFGVNYLKKNYSFTSQSTSTEPIAEQKIADGCSRTTRLDNAPQYDRALSLIQQRIDDNEKWCDKYCESKEYEKKLRFHQFPADLTNCIKIVEEDIDGDAEGYFTFDSDDIQPNYFPITVDSSYSFSDDTLTALLIVHEMTHVQQYLGTLNGNDDLSCRDKEVEAFISQIDFYTLLSNEEIDSIVLKMNESKEDKHPQVAMLKTMVDINRDGTCPLFTDDECSEKNLRNKLFQIISDDPIYQHQCGL